MYRLLALSFLNVGMAVAIVGYRTYPDADVSEQTKDLSLALDVLKSTKPFLFYAPSAKYSGACIMGHSSGAHIALMLIYHQIKVDSTPFHSFVGISGPYCINSHFEYEAFRGVEQISPMKVSVFFFICTFLTSCNTKAACGHTPHNFLLNSPHVQIYHYLSEHPDRISHIPRLLFVHGIMDATVPFATAADAAKLLRSCGVKNVQELYLSKVNHTDAIVQFMIGGKTCDRVIHWLQNDDFLSDVYLDGSSL